jgi:hypothetical protein
VRDDAAGQRLAAGGTDFALVRVFACVRVPQSRHTGRESDVYACKVAGGAPGGRDLMAQTGRDTYYPGASPDPPRIHLDDAARQTLPVFDAPPGLTIVVDDRAA